MNLLLDTHAFLWFIVGNPNLSANARALIEDQANEKLLSVASFVGNSDQGQYRQADPIRFF